MALLAEEQDNESYAFWEMCKQDDAAKFIKGTMQESSKLEPRDHWTVVQRLKKPPHVGTILAILVFKRKGYPDGTINMQKA